MRNKGKPIRFGKPSWVNSSLVKDSFKMTSKTGSKVKKAIAFTTGKDLAGVELMWQKFFQKYLFAINCVPQVFSVKIDRKTKFYRLEPDQIFYDQVDQFKCFLLPDLFL